MIVGMHWDFASQRLSSDLRPVIGNHSVYIHIELGATTRHPCIQWELVLILICQNFIAISGDQIALRRNQAPGALIHQRGTLLRIGIGRDHFPPNQILADREVLKRALGLRTPQLIRGNRDRAKAACSTRVVVSALDGMP
jgi:hypothetical protein